MRGKRLESGLRQGRERLIPARAGKTQEQTGTAEETEAHPRACGENHGLGSGWSAFGGSSPRVRGKLPDRLGAACRRRLIPARAGKTPRPPGPRAAPGAHPRACGENLVLRVHVAPGRGSSPRVRGKLSARPPGGIGRGLIPARAGKTWASRSLVCGKRAHPRACGENTAWAACWGTTPGSSPRVRGKPVVLQARPCRGGLIPARAGKTPHPQRKDYRPWAHPRACGENSPDRFQALRGVGSSPRVRGKRPCLVEARVTVGLIPARAGKTSPSMVSAGPNAAHPRACGENSNALVAREVLHGSSPRVRGKPRRDTRLWGRARLIPARAGKTPAASIGRCGGSAHPRACGENAWEMVMLAVDAGSSPRGRGKRQQYSNGLASAGLIPARAGKTFRGALMLCVARAHPRACGENGAASRGSQSRLGSSPRVRGKPGQLGEVTVARGLIPARAGKTVASLDSSATRWAHPRACGENATSESSNPAIPGSSPRVRGKLGPCCPSSQRSRLIPARAGKTSVCCCGPGREPAHPRACGENAVANSWARGLAGSSPRVRGKRHDDAIAGQLEGLIPARAGKTIGNVRCFVQCGAHPRACGENCRMFSCEFIGHGSSPRVRGKRGRRPRRDRVHGLIPARAGKTPRTGRPSRSAPAHPRACGENLDLIKGLVGV